MVSCCAYYSTYYFQSSVDVHWEYCATYSHVCNVFAPRTKGFSLGHWVQKTGKEGSKLNGQGGVTSRGITVEELASHNSEDDIWMALNGLVYNVTAYMPYHPGGGAELMRAAGGDGTRLFHEIHPWINIQSFLGKCYVGPLVRGTSGATGQRNGPRNSPLSQSTMSLVIEICCIFWFYEDHAYYFLFCRRSQTGFPRVAFETIHIHIALIFEQLHLRVAAIYMFPFIDKKILGSAWKCCKATTNLLLHNDNCSPLSSGSNCLQSTRSTI